MNRKIFLLLIPALLAGGCARAVQIGSDSSAGTTYRIQVRNESTETLVVSYNDGRGDAILGTVQRNVTESYVIASPARTDVTVKGVGSTRTSGPYTITLAAGTQQLVRLR